jgi:hypothetical protein
VTLGVLSAPGLGAGPSRGLGLWALGSGLWAIDVVHGPVEVVLTVTKVKRVVIDAPQVVTPHTVEEWTRLLEALPPGSITALIRYQSGAPPSPSWSAP